MNKSELLGQLENAKNNFVIGMAGVSLLGDPLTLKALENHSVSFGNFQLPLDQVANMMRSVQDRDIALKEFVLSLYRALIKETFEIVRQYASASNQSETLRAGQDYHFWRMIRNSVSHDAHWRFNSFDLRLVPLTWRGVRLDASMQDQPFAIQFLGYDGLFQLYLDMAGFAQTSLD